jgi:class 3 adenylate cyclase
VEPPRTRYAHSGDVSIAYQVVGDGPFDLVHVPAFVSHLEMMWDNPRTARFCERLASFSRMIMFDKRGTGLSDRGVSVGDLETRMDDIRAVMEAAGSQSAALLGYSEGGALASMFAATYPARTRALALVDTWPRTLVADDYPMGATEQEVEESLREVEEGWGNDEFFMETMVRNGAQSAADDPEFVRWYLRFLRNAASPGAAADVLRVRGGLDVRHVFPALTVPTLVITTALPAEGRWIADRIPGAKLVDLPHTDHNPFTGNPEGILDEVEEFLTGARHRQDPDRQLATVLFTDIVGSTERAVAVGDARWRTLLESHHAILRRELVLHRGRELDTAGDGFFATFDGPARAVRCALSASQAVRALGIEIRAGVHTGECEVIGTKLGGVAVHIGARVASLAGPGEVLVSNTVKDLVAGSGLSFDPRGSHALKGIPGEWPIFAAVA